MLKEKIRKTGKLLAALAVTASIFGAVGVSAADVEQINDFDVYNNTNIGTDANGGHAFIKDWTYQRVNSVNINGTTNVLSEMIQLVTNPVSGDYSDKVVKFTKPLTAGMSVINPNVTTFSPYEKKTVLQHNIMLDGQVLKDTQMLFISSVGGNVIFARIQPDANGNGVLQAHETASTKHNVKTLEKGKWYNVMVVTDMTAKDTSGNDDPTKYTMDLYVNGELLYSWNNLKAWAESWRTFDFTKIYGYQMPLGTNASDATEKSVIYYDNYRHYQPSGDVSVNLTSPVSDTTYMYGSKIKLSAKENIGQYLETIGGVKYYDNGVLVAESTVAPYYCYYTPTKAGTHNIQAKAYMSGDESEILAESAVVTVTVDQKFEETVLHELKEIPTGTSVWDLRGTKTVTTADGKTETVSPYSHIEIDKWHENSILSSGDSGRSVYLALPTRANSGYVKMSGEFYIPEGQRIDNTFIFFPRSGTVGDTRLEKLGGGAQLSDWTNDSAAVNTNLSTGRWYKMDIIIKLKDAEKQGYIEMYLDGAKVRDDAFPKLKVNSTGNQTDYTAIPEIYAVWYSLHYDTRDLIFDNFTFSTLKMDYEPTVLSNGVEIDAFEDIENGVVTATVKAQDADECTLIMGLYDGDSLIDVEVATKDASGRTFSASFDKGAGYDFEGKTIKAMSWNNLDKFVPLGLVVLDN